MTTILHDRLIEDLAFPTHGFWKALKQGLDRENEELMEEIAQQQHFVPDAYFISDRPGPLQVICFEVEVTHHNDPFDKWVTLAETLDYWGHEFSVIRVDRLGRRWDAALEADTAMWLREAA